MSIYEYDDYKVFLTDLIRTFPKAGRGQARRLAEHLGVNSVVISQILAGDRHLTPEQGLAVAEYFGLDERATEFLLVLIQQARAGTVKLRQHFQMKLDRTKQEALNIKNRVVTHGELSEIDKGVFYSNWFYSGIRLLSSIPEYNSPEKIATYFGLSRAKTNEVLEFLISRGLCVEENGKIKMGVTATHVAANSKFVNSHRRNWRLKGFEKFTEPNEQQLFYSGPYSLSAKDYDQIRKELVELISKVSKRVADSPEEKLACLNIDFFEF